MFGGKLRARWRFEKQGFPFALVQNVNSPSYRQMGPDRNYVQRQTCSSLPNVSNISYYFEYP